MKLAKFLELVGRFLCMFLVFVFVSVILRGKTEWVGSLCWSLGFTILLAIRDELSEAIQRIFNLVMFGAAIVMLTIEVFYSTNTQMDYAVECLLLIYSGFRFCEAYAFKIE